MNKVHVIIGIVVGLASLEQKISTDRADALQERMWKLVEGLAMRVAGVMFSLDARWAKAEREDRYGPVENMPQEIKDEYRQLKLEVDKILRTLNGEKESEHSDRGQ